MAKITIELEGDALELFDNEVCHDYEPRDENDAQYLWKDGENLHYIPFGVMPPAVRKVTNKDRAAFLRRYISKIVD